MFKKLKRILSLSIVTAMIMSLVGVLPVMAATDPNKLDAGDYKATYANSDPSKDPKKLSMGTVGEVTATVNAMGKVTFTLKITARPDKVNALYLGGSYNSKKESGVVVESDILLPTVNEDGSKSYTIKDVTGINKDNKEASFTVSVKTSETKWSDTDVSFKLTVGDKAVKVPEGDPEPDPVPVKTAKLEIIRTGNFSENNTNTPYDREFFVTSYDDASKTAVVTLEGKFLKLFMGSYGDAEKASEGITELTPGTNYTDVTIKNVVFDKAMAVSLYQSSMGGKWREYSFTFSKGECDHTYADGICSKCGAVDKTNKDHFVVGEKEVAIKSDKNTSVVITKEAFADTADKAVALETKVGKVTFDAKAFATIIGASETDITFEMNNIKDTPLFAKSKYDVVLDLSIKDANGTPLFATAGNGKATVTVPYDKEVPEGKKVAVFYITDEGREEVEAKYDAETKTISFEVEHFSTYAVQQVDDTTTANVTNTGDSSQMIFVMIALFASLLVSGAAFNKKRNYI